MLSNVFYFVCLMFKYSPGLVIGEMLWGLILKLPYRLVSVVGVKYIIDAADSENAQRKIFAAVVVVAVVIILGKTFAWIFREFYWNAEKERAYKGLNKALYKKAKSLDLSFYDDPHFYNNFILTIESSSDNIQNVLGLVRNSVGELVSLITISAILLTIDPICLVIIFVIIVIFTPISRKNRLRSNATQG
ncbi:MAG: hypothetical protein LUG95_05705 [Clostridiales bacterium]|nr:hypothetical protein [Clostridiales bacterium]